MAEEDDKNKAISRDLNIFKNNVIDFNPMAFIKTTPCAREALLDGMGAGALLGGGFGAATRNIGKACNLAVGAFVFVSALSWEHRRNQLQREKQAAKDIVDRLNQMEDEKRRSEGRA